MTGPDRIFAWPWEVNPRMGQWADEQQIVGEGVEYIRRDPAVLAALPEVQALIAVALQSIADKARTELAAAWAADLIAQWVRNATPADALAARDAIAAEAVAKERAACAELAASSTVPAQTAMRLAAAIRKRGEG